VNDAERLSQDRTFRLIGSEKIWNRFAGLARTNGGLNGEGDCLAAKLRPGNVHSADDWEELLLPEIERQQKQGKEVVFRADGSMVRRIAALPLPTG